MAENTKCQSSHQLVCVWALLLVIITYKPLQSPNKKCSKPPTRSFFIHYSELRISVMFFAIGPENYRDLWSTKQKLGEDQLSGGSSWLAKISRGHCQLFQFLALDWSNTSHGTPVLVEASTWWNRHVVYSKVVLLKDAFPGRFDLACFDLANFLGWQPTQHSSVRGDWANVIIDNG